MQFPQVYGRPRRGLTPALQHPHEATQSRVALVSDPRPEADRLVVVRDHHRRDPTDAQLAETSFGLVEEEPPDPAATPVGEDREAVEGPPPPVPAHDQRP